MLFRDDTITYAENAKEPTKKPTRTTSKLVRNRKKRFVVTKMFYTMIVVVDYMTVHLSEFIELYSSKWYIFLRVNYTTMKPTQTGSIT